MSRQVLYVAAPLRPTEEELDAIPYQRVERGQGEYELDTWTQIPPAERVALALRANLDRAMRWLAWLRRSFPETTFIAPWIATVMSLDGDDSPALREAGLVDDCAVIERCDGIVLCGGRISEGMRREMEHGQMRHKVWIDPADQRPGFKTYSLCGMNEPPLGGPPLFAYGGRPTFDDWARAVEDE